MAILRRRSPGFLGDPWARSGWRTRRPGQVVRLNLGTIRPYLVTEHIDAPLWYDKDLHPAMVMRAAVAAVQPRLRRRWVDPPISRIAVGLHCLREIPDTASVRRAGGWARSAIQNG
ncbi:hypothetical protein GCM10028790_33070 [Micromonospora taraxaci]